MALRVSVALCTYNGGRFLSEQLESLTRQTRPPDELVVCDDASTDGTPTIVEGFAAAAPFPVRLTINQRTRGVAPNFDQAIRQCNGDVIALCDQDDVWHTDRLARGLHILEHDPLVGLVFSDAEIVDERLRPLGYRLWETLGFGRGEQARIVTAEAVEVLLRHQVVTGSTATFRASYRDLIAPIPTSWVHDGWIAFLIAALGQLAVIREPLVLYRQHAGNQIGGRRQRLWQLAARASRERTRRTLAAEVQRLSAARDRLARAARPPRHPQTFHLIDDALAHVRMRGELPDRRWRRWRPIAQEWLAGRYARYSNGLVSVLQDFLL